MTAHGWNCFSWKRSDEKLMEEVADITDVIRTFYVLNWNRITKYRNPQDLAGIVRII